MIFVFLISLVQGVFAIEILDVRGTPPENSYHWSLTDTQNSSQLFQKIPNINFSSGAHRPRFFQIRGVGERSQFDNLNQSPVGFFYEEIDLSEEPYAIRTRNKKVLAKKESQSVHYGSKGMGGLFLLETCQERCIDNLTVGVGSFNTFYGESLINTETSRWQSQFSVHFRNSDGYQDNSFLNRKTGDEKENYWELHNKYNGPLAIETHHIFTSQDNGYDYFNFNNDYISESDRPGRENNMVHGHAVLIPFGTVNQFQSITSFTNSLSQQSYDEDWGNNPSWLNTPGWNQNYDYNSANEFIKHKFHQKLVYTKDWFFVGLHYFYKDDRINNRAFKDGKLRSHLNVQSPMNSYALFAGFNGLLNRIETDTSFRLENQQRRLTGKNFNENSQEWLWAIEQNFKYPLSDQKTIYGTLSKGFRGGGYNLEASLSPEKRLYQPENLYLAQLGYKKRYSYLNYDLKIFYMLRDQMQLRTSFQDDPSDPSSFTYYTDNASSSQNYGAELSINFHHDKWTYQFMFATMNSSFGDYQYGGQNFTQRQLPYSPRYSFLFEVGYQWTQSVLSSFSYYGQEAFYFSNSHNQKSKAYQLLDFNLNYVLGSWNFLFRVNNVFNHTYQQRGFFFANEPPLWQEKLYTQASPPRSLWLEMAYHF